MSVSDREREVLIAWRDLDGDLDAVARELGISRNTVRVHLQNARAKTHTRKTWVAVRRLIET